MEPVAPNVIAHTIGITDKIEQVKEYAEKEGVTEQLKAADQMARLRRMNNIRIRVTEVVNAEVIFV